MTEWLSRGNDRLHKENVALRLKNEQLHKRGMRLRRVLREICDSVISEGDVIAEIEKRALRDARNVLENEK